MVHRKSPVLKKRTKLRILLIFMCLLFLGLAVDLLASWKLISVSRYEYFSDKADIGFKVVQLSDLHNWQFGTDNSRLIQCIKKELPDVIFMTGDMLNDDERNTKIILNLIEETAKIAPVYFALGNHEVGYLKNFPEKNSLINDLEQAGAVVLDQEYTDTEIAGQEVRIGGIYGYVLDREWKDGSEQRFMETFQNTNRLKILLAHVPEGLLLWKSMETWDVDLVFSGHVHGGQVRIPFIGGLFDPEEGWFPTYTKGMFTCGGGTMILSAGLGSSRGIPRINNLPDLVVCEIKGD